MSKPTDNRVSASVVLTTVAVSMVAMTGCSWLAGDPPRRRALVDNDASTLRHQAMMVLRVALARESGWVKVHAAEAMIAHGRADEVMPVYRIELAQATDPAYRVGCARVLYRAGERDAVSVILEILDGNDVNGRIHAAGTLAKLRYSGARAQLERVQQSEDPILSVVATAALARVGDAGALARLQKALDGEDPSVRTWAAWGFAATTGLTDDTRNRLRLLHAHNGAAGDDAMYALVRQGDRSLVSQLVFDLRSSSAGKRKYAALTLGQVRYYKALDRIVPLLDDADAHVRVRAAQAVLRMVPASAPPPTRNDRSPVAEIGLSTLHAGTAGTTVAGCPGSSTRRTIKESWQDGETAWSGLQSLNYWGPSRS